MKRHKISSVSHNLPPANLYPEDVKQIVDIIAKKFNAIEITAGDYDFESPMR